MDKVEEEAEQEGDDLAHVSGDHDGGAECKQKEEVRM